MRIGLGLRPHFRPFLGRGLPHVDFIEVTAEHYINQSEFVVPGSYPVALHCLALSVGSPTALDAPYLREIARLADFVDAIWITDHLAFTKAAGIDLGHLNPIPLTQKTLSRVAGKVLEIQQVSGRRFLIENITSHLLLPGDLSEPDFLNKLCRRTGCGVLLDITNLYVNSRNHHFDPLVYIDQLDLANVKQFHLIGYSCEAGILNDDHGSSVQKELLDLLASVVARKSNAPVLIEWDRNFPTYDQLLVNLNNVNEVMSGSDRSIGETAVFNLA